MQFENLSVELSELPDYSVAEYTFHPGSFKRKKLLSSGIFFLILLTGPVIVLFTAPTIAFIFTFAGWALLAALRLLVIMKDFPKRAYAVRERDITYRKGWIFQSVTSVPFNRIQHSEISQGPLDRMFSLASLKIYTAGGSSSDLTIPGLPHERALKLREFIAGKASDDESGQ